MDRRTFKQVMALALILLFDVHAFNGQANRADAAKKGSLLIFSKVEVKWDGGGNVTQDTFIELSND